MPFPARGENLKLGKGSLMIGLWSGQTPPTKFDFAGNCTSVALSADVTTAEKFSSTEKSGSLVDRRPLRTAYTLTVAMDEQTKENLKLFLLGESASRSQSESTDFEVTIENVELDKYYPLNRRRLQDVAVYTSGSVQLTAGTDYEVNTEFGWIRPIAGGAINDGDDITVYASQPGLTIDQIRIAQDSAPIAHVEFLCDDANNEANPAKDHLKLWKVSVAPEGELAFVSEDYASFSLTMSVLSDSLHTDDPFGVLERIRA